MTPISGKTYGIGGMLILSLLICIYTCNQEPENYEDHNLCEQHGWQMDTTYNVDSSKFIVSLHYYQEIEYQIDTVEVIEEDGIRWYTLDTIHYDSIDTTIIHYPWGREEIYYFKYKENE